MNTQYSLFLIRESSMDDISNATRFSNINLNSLITEASGESFIDKIKRIIKFIMNKISNFFSNMTSSQDEMKNRSSSIAHSKTKEVELELYEKIYNNQFNPSEIAEKALNELKSVMEKEITEPGKQATEFAAKYVDEKNRVTDMLGEKKKFTVNKEKGTQILTTVTNEINDFNKVHQKLKDLYASIESKLKPDLSSEEQTQINHKLTFLNDVAGYLFNYLKSITKLVNAQANTLVVHFSK